MTTSIEPGELVIGRYRIVRKIGSGGTGSVYEATHVITGKRVALKWLRAELAKEEAKRRRLLREARVAATVEHPNAVDIYDVGRIAPMNDLWGVYVMSLEPSRFAAVIHAATAF